MSNSRMLSPSSPPQSPVLPAVLSSDDWDNSILEQLLAWAESSTEGEKIVPEIEFESARQLQKQLILRGFSIRFNWSGIDGSAQFKMITRLHELPGSWLVHNLPQINKHISEVATCGLPSVVSKGSASVKLGDGKGTKKSSIFTWGKKTSTSHSKYQPDASLYLQYTDPETDEISNIGTMPRVVLETAFSQELVYVLHKACDWLYNCPGGNIHAVIICDARFEDKEKKEGLEVKISVWVRRPTGTPHEDYPEDKCRAGVRNPHRPRSVAQSDTESEHAAPSLSPSQTSHAPNATQRFHALKKDGNKDFEIWNRSGWKYVLRSDGSTGDEEIALSFYDFVRLCEKERDHPILPLESQEIVLKLKWLRQQLLAELPVYCGDIKDAVAVKDELRKYPAASRVPRPWRYVMKHWPWSWPK